MPVKHLVNAYGGVSSYALTRCLTGISIRSVRAHVIIEDMNVFDGWELLERELASDYQELAAGMNLIRPLPPHLRTKISDASALLRLLLFHATGASLEVTTGFRVHRLKLGLLTFGQDCEFLVLQVKGALAHALNPSPDGHCGKRKGCSLRKELFRSCVGNKHG